MLFGFIGGTFQQLHIDDTLQNGGSFWQNQSDYLLVRAAYFVDDRGDFVIYIDVYGVFARLLCAHVFFYTRNILSIFSRTESPGSLENCKVSRPTRSNPIAVMKV